MTVCWLSEMKQASGLTYVVDSAFIFVKLWRSEILTYDFSNLDSMLARENQLYSVARILKRIAAQIPAEG